MEMERGKQKDYANSVDGKHYHLQTINALDVLNIMQQLFMQLKNLKQNEQNFQSRIFLEMKNNGH